MPLHIIVSVRFHKRHMSHMDLYYNRTNESWLNFERQYLKWLSFVRVVVNMDVDAVIRLESTLIITVLLTKGRVKSRRKRKLWVRKWIARRESRGAYNAIMQELRLEDAEGYRRYLRMNTDSFEVRFANYVLFNVTDWQHYTLQPWALKKPFFKMKFNAFSSSK